MKKLSIKAILLIIATLLSIINLSAQITIGSLQSPISGALLDLKMDGATTKGLNLPRVELTNLKPTNGTDLSASIGGDGSENWDLSAHIGLVVFNTKYSCNNGLIQKGPYLWDGAEWQYWGKKLSNGAYEFTDTRDGEVYIARDFGTEAGEWMLENLRYVPTTSDFTHTGALSSYRAYCYPGIDEDPYNPANHPSAVWRKNLGLLYNWHAATNKQNPSYGINQGEGNLNAGPANPIQGICPPGWHLPSDKEWNRLEKEIYNNPLKYNDTYTSSDFSQNNWNTSWDTEENAWRGGIPFHGGKAAHGVVMRTSCPPPGSNVQSDGQSFPATHGGFNVWHTGFGSGGKITNYGYSADFWASSNADSNVAWTRFFNTARQDVNKSKEPYTNFASIRCKKD